STASPARGCARPTATRAAGARMSALSKFDDGAWLARGVGQVCNPPDHPRQVAELPYRLASAVCFRRCSMAVRSLRWLSVLVMLASLPLGSAQAQYTIKEAATDPPEELDKSIAGLLSKNAVQLLDSKGDLLCEVWFRQDVPSTANAQQLKNGLAYQD